MTMPMLSIVIVNYNAREHLENCLASLHSSPPAIPHDIIVVDNASTDGSADAVRERWPAVKVLAQTSNGGFAAGNNAGIGATTGSLLLLLNNDTIVPPGAVDALVARLLADAEAAVAGPHLIDGDGRTELSFGRMMSPVNELRQKLIVSMYDRGVGVAARWVQQAASREQHVDWVSGACLLVRRADAEAAGGLDERYFLYAEDVDFCAAIRQLDRRVLFSPAACVIHLRGRSRSTEPARMNTAYRRSQLAFYEKHHPGWAPLLRLYLRVKGQLPR